MGTIQKTKDIQSYLRIWGCYDPIESDPSETGKGELYRFSIKKKDFWANFGPKKRAFLDQKRATLGNWGPETACRAAKWPPTGKLSRVTSGYGEA